MPYSLDIQQESLSYTVRYARPAFELWGTGGTVVGGLYNALSPHGVPLQNFQIATSVSSAADVIFTVKIAQYGVLKFTLEKMEFSFANFTEDTFRSIPQMLEASTRWLRSAIPSLKFAGHTFTYYNHSHIKGLAVEQFLRTVNARDLKSAGTSRGNGAIFNYTVPEHNWTTQVIVDRSVLVADALYLNLTLGFPGDMLDYPQLLSKGRYYLAQVLGELNLSLPELLISE